MPANVFRHIRYTVRLLARSPIFTLTAVASLAIGLGANVAIFSVANAVLLAPTGGVHDMARLVDIGRTVRGEGFDNVSFPTYADLRDRQTLFDGVYAARLEPKAFSVGAEDGALRVYGQQVSASYFDVIGVTPAAGGFFRTGEEQLGVPLRKVVISHPFWRRHFDASPQAIGQELRLNGDIFTVVGVTPEGFTGTTILGTDLWVPVTAYANAMTNDETLRSRRSVFLMMGARLKPDVSVAQAQDSLDAFMRTLAEEHPEAYRDTGLKAAPASRVPGEAGMFVVPFVSMLLGVVGLVLLVACTNLAGLLLSRAADRSREVAVRLALGAPRGAIAGLVMTETLVVFAIGAAGGWLIAAGMTRLLASSLTSLPVPIAIDLTLDWRVAAFGVLLTLAAAVLTGLAPTLQTIGPNLIGDLRKDAQTSPRRQRMRRAFIAAQLAFCVVLVIAAGLFVRALGAATTIDPGFELDGIEVASVELGLGGYPADRLAAVSNDIRSRLAALPGVEAVGSAVVVPLAGGGMGLGGLRRPGTTDPRDTIGADWNVISPEFLPTLRLPIRRGRNFTAADRDGAPLVAIVSEHLARSAWPDADPLGQVLENGDFRPGQESSIRRLTVVGVARDVKSRWLGDVTRPFVYVPLAQHPMPSANYFIRRNAELSGDATLQPAVRAALKVFDPNLPLIHMAPFRSYADLGLLPQRIAASVAGSLGIVALLLAAIGVYGVTAFAVASRTREIGVRMALGADAARVLRDVLGQGLRLTAIGAGIGIAASLALTPLIADLLFGVSAFDPITFGVTAAALVAISLAATWLPARRAAHVDPLTALRAE